MQLSVIINKNDQNVEIRMSSALHFPDNEQVSESAALKFTAALSDRDGQFIYR